MARKGTEKTPDLSNGRTSHAPNGNGSNGGMDGNIGTEEISARAYEIYVREGRVDGRDTEHWLRAESELRAERQNAGRQRNTAQPAAPAPRSARRTQTQVAIA